MEQSIFNYNFKPKLNIDDFYVNASNKTAYNFIINKDIKNSKILLIGSNKSGKTHLGRIWLSIHEAILFDNNLQYLLNNKKNILIDNFLHNINEEHIFHIVNHCNLNNLNILLTSNINLSAYNFKLLDLLSRLKTFSLLKINLPDDELIINLIIKLLHDKQVIINNLEIFQYILKRINRSYEEIYLFVEKVDKLSLEQKRELTIPLIRDLI